MPEPGSVLLPVLMAIPGPDPASPPEQAARQTEWGRKALARCALQMGLPAEGWPKDASGAPLPQNGYHWSVSHTRGMVAAVIAAGPVGIDVECIRPRHQRIFDHVADLGEWRLLGTRSWDNFFRLWTAKEAVVKAHGRGVGWIRECILEQVSPTRLSLQFEGRRWEVAHHRLEQHIAAVTVSSDLVEWVVV